MRTIPDNPCVDVTIGLLIVLAGLLLFIYRQPIGEATGYYVGRGTTVDKPTPGCLLIPFALALIAGGTAIAAGSMYRLFGGH